MAYSRPEQTEKGASNLHQNHPASRFEPIVHELLFLEG